MISNSTIYCMNMTFFLLTQNKMQHVGKVGRVSVRMITCWFSVLKAINIEQKL